jgi:hypothetical protein
MESHGQQALFSCRSKHSRRNPPSSLCGAAGLGERGHAGPGWKASACESTIWRVTITFSRSWPVGISRSGHTLRPEDFLEARTKRLRQRCGTGGVPSAFVAFDGPDLFGSAALVQHDLPDRTNLEPWLAGVYVTPSVRRQGIAAALVSAVEVERGVPARPKCGSPVGYDDPNPDL